MTTSPHHALHSASTVGLGTPGPGSMRRSQVNSQARAQACTFNTTSAAKTASQNGDPRWDAHQPAAMANMIKLSTQLRCNFANMINSSATG